MAENWLEMVVKQPFLSVTNSGYQSLLHQLLRYTFEALHIESFSKIGYWDTRHFCTSLTQTQALRKSYQSDLGNGSNKHTDTYTSLFGSCSTPQKWQKQRFKTLQLAHQLCNIDFAKHGFLYLYYVILSLGIPPNFYRTDDIQII